MHIFTFEIIRAATGPLRCDQFPGGCILSSLGFLQPQCVSFCPHFIALGAQPIVLLFVVSLSHADASAQNNTIFRNPEFKRSEGRAKRDPEILVYIYI